MLYIGVFLVSVFISSVSQIILKSSADKEKKSFLQEYLNVKVITAYGLFFVSSLITILAYKYVPLSMGPILEASGYIFVAVLGFLFLKERIGKRKLAGLCCIIAGITIFSVAG